MVRLDHIVLHVTPYAVLRTKERREIDVRMLVKQIRDVPKTVIDRRLITNQTDPRAPHEINSILEKLFNSQGDGLWFTSAHNYLECGGRAKRRHRFGFLLRSGMSNLKSEMGNYPKRRRRFALPAQSTY